MFVNAQSQMLAAAKSFVVEGEDYHVSEPYVHKGNEYSAFHIINTSEYHGDYSRRQDNLVAVDISPFEEEEK